MKLIKTFLFTSVFFTANSVIAQDLQGRAIYESKIVMGEGFKIESPDLTEEIKKQMMENVKKAFEKTFILDFNKTESVYEEQQKLSVSKGNSMAMVLSDDGGKLYKNSKNQQYIKEVEEDLSGKDFLITDSLPNYNWKIEGETKKIGLYTCYKAVSITKVSEKAIKEYEEQKKKSETNKTQFFIMDEPKDKVITAWYTPDIPISNGPENYWGLPGLILEVNEGKTTLLCSKIVINPKDKTVIKTPKKGKVISQKNYDELVEKHFEKMKDKDGIIHIEIHAN